MVTKCIKYDYQYTFYKISDCIQKYLFTLILLQICSPRLKIIGETIIGTNNKRYVVLQCLDVLIYSFYTRMRSFLLNVLPTISYCFSTSRIFFRTPLNHAYLSFQNTMRHTHKHTHTHLHTQTHTHK